MTHEQPRRLGLLVALIAVFGAINTCRLSAQTRVLSSDENSRFLAMGISKSVVVELSRDIKDIVIADRTVASAFALSRRKVEIIGASLGQTNVYFFDANNKMIEGFNVAVKDTTQPAGLEDYPYPASTAIIVYGGGPNGSTVQIPISCTPIRCLDARKPGADQPPGTENINITGNTSGVLVNGGK
jgi:hypothetical protein